MFCVLVRRCSQRVKDTNVSVAVAVTLSGICSAVSVLAGGLHLLFSLAEVSYDQNLFTHTSTHDAHRVCDVLSQAIHTILQALSIIRVLWMMRVFTKTYDMPHVATYNDVWSRHTHRSVKYLADTFVCRRFAIRLKCAQRVNWRRVGHDGWAGKSILRTQFNCANERQTN